MKTIIFVETKADKMKNIAIQVVNKKDYSMVVSMLQKLADRKIIKVKQTEEDLREFPGPLMDDEELLSAIEKAELTEALSSEAAKLIFEQILAKAEAANH